MTTAFTYDALPGRVVFGVGAFERAAHEVERLGLHRLLLIADRSAAGWVERLAGQLGDRAVGRIDDVRAHVPRQRAEAARALASQARADGVVTLGGGSSTGLGKAVALTTDVVLIAIPTTYAGSEMTPIWGLTTDGHKQTGRDLRVLPRLVVYDPRLTLSLPPAIAGPSGINALAHCAEALYADGANPVTSLLAEEGIRVLADSLPRVTEQPDDLDARGDALMGAYLAGTSLAAAGAGIHHKICHVLGGLYDLPHAEMHTVVLPHALAFNAPAVPDAIARMARALGELDVPAALFDLATKLGAPTSLAQIGLAADQLDEATEHIVAEAAANPRPVTRAAIQRLLADAFAGRRPTLDEAQQGGPSDTPWRISSGQPVS